MAFVLVCSGECDFVSLDQLRRELQLLKTEPDPVLDLTGLRYIDSRAIAEIVNLHREREALGLPRERIIVKPSSLVHRVFEVLNLQKVLDVIDSRSAIAVDLRITNRVRMVMFGQSKT